MLVTETTGIKLLLKIIVLNPKDGHLIFIPIKLSEKIIEFPKFFIDTGRSSSILFAVGLFNVNIAVIFVASNCYIHARVLLAIFYYSIKSTKEHA